MTKPMHGTITAVVYATTAADAVERAIRGDLDGIDSDVTWTGKWVAVRSPGDDSDESQPADDLVPASSGSLTATAENASVEEPR